MPRPLLSDITAWITEAALAHPGALPSHLCERLQVSRRTAHALLRKLVAAQWLRREGTAGKPRFAPGLMRQVVRRYALAGLQEDLPWSQDFAPGFELPAPVGRMVQHVFTELLNNAIDHSGGASVTVSLRQTPLQVQLLVSDDGRGVFDAIGQAFQINDPSLAMLALAKGKLSSQPDRHTGRGLFFAAKLADIFDLHANHSAFQQRGWQPERWHRGRPACARGSSVYVAIRLDTERTLDEVLRRYSLDGAGYRFERTVVPLALLTAEHTGLESRAQARRVVERLTEFRRVELDFDGLADVGHGFADELFRVFGGQHPQLQLVPLNMAPRVAALIDSVREPVPA
jgi:anti-sigma regulatory factor (Ser/Thr protein kinase)